MKKIILLLLLQIILLTTMACEQSNYDIAATLFPQYDIARNIVIDKLSIHLVRPVGSEIHDYEPTSFDYLVMKNSKLLLYTSTTLDANFLNDDILSTTNCFDVSSNIETLDLHYWTDPVNFIIMIDTILQEIIDIDSANASFYTENANSYKTLIQNKTESFTKAISTKENRTIFYTGHASMTLFATRFDLNIETPTNNTTHEQEISSAMLLEFIEKIKNSNTTILFVEELESTQLALKIVEELSNNRTLALLELHGYHNVSLKDLENNICYSDLLQRNIDNVIQAL